MKNNEMNETDKKILQNRLKERRLFLDMTYQDLADKTGLSKSTLQRYETGGIKNLPYDKIFILSEALEVNPSYFTDLSKDYTGNSEDITKLSERSEIINKVKEFEEKAIQQITPQLISSGYMVEQYNRGSLGDLVAIKGNEIWHIDFLYQKDVSKQTIGKGIGRQQLLLRLGRLVLYDKPITKYSIAVDRRYIAEQLIQQMRYANLNIQISVILLKNNGYEELLLHPY